MGNPWWILGDAESINLAILNLCFNSLDAMPDGGTLALRTAAIGPDLAEISVEDNGAGMTPEVLSHSLEPFFTTKPDGTGVGLGLSLTYGVVKAHGGTIDISSQPGRGTAVKLRFPRTPARSASKASRNPCRPSTCGRSSWWMTRRTCAS